jgi:UDP-N-acetylglucosamine acyltransferase
MNVNIHPTAIVSPGAQLAAGVSIGPFCIISGRAKIGAGTKIMSNVIIDGNTEIGDNCAIYPFAGIGLPPQDLKYDDRETGVKIGNDNIIREYTSIHRASINGDGITTVGDKNFIMAYVHIAHDCKVASHTTMANAATLAGHVEVDDHAVIGGVTAVHQFTRIGAYAMVGGFSGVGQDVPPFTVVSGPRAKLYGLNLIGLKRHGFSNEKLQILKKAYKILFMEKLTMNEALEKLALEIPATDEIKILTDFITANRKRGILRKT